MAAGCAMFATCGCVLAADVAKMVGYSPSAAAGEAAVEAKYRALTSPEQIQKFHRYLTAEPHPAGSSAK